MNGVIYLSATQIKKFLLCQQKWICDKILAMPEPDTFKKTWGTALHKWAEDYLCGAPLDTFPAGTIRTALEKAVALGHLPTPRSGIAEHDFTIPIYSDVVLTGRIDYLAPLAPGRDDEGIVLDHKTTSSPKYMMTEAGLITDPQATIYSVAARPIFPKGHQLRWVYYIVTGDKDAPSNIAVRLVAAWPRESDIARSFDALEAPINAMVAMRRAGQTEGEKNQAACKAYGGCPYQGYCWKNGRSLGSFLR